MIFNRNFKIMWLLHCIATVHWRHGFFFNTGNVSCQKRNPTKTGNWTGSCQKKFITYIFYKCQNCQIIQKMYPLKRKNLRNAYFWLKAQTLSIVFPEIFFIIQPLVPPSYLFPSLTGSGRVQGNRCFCLNTFKRLVVSRIRLIQQLFCLVIKIIHVLKKQG